MYNKLFIPNTPNTKDINIIQVTVRIPFYILIKNDQLPHI